MRLATAGSVDDGKSTLIGRLLYDSKSLMADEVARAEVDLAHLIDGLRAEREQGITIDVAYRFFATPRRSFIIADTPGHVRYTRNMVTGASTADVALVLVDARNGIVEQSRRHASIASLLGIRHLIACVNKMDLVDWDEARFREIESGFAAMAERLGIGDVARDPAVGAQRRQRRRRLRRDAVVRRRAAAGPARAARGGGGPQPRGRPLPGPADDPRHGLPRLCRPRGRRRAAHGRRGRRAAGGGDDDDRAHRHAARAGRGGRAAAGGDDRARRRARRRPRRHDLRAGEPARRRPPHRGDGLLDGRGAAARRRPLRAQAHDAPRAGDDRGDPVARGHGDARLRRAARTGSSSTTSARCACAPPCRCSPTPTAATACRARSSSSTRRPSRPSARA